MIIRLLNIRFRQLTRILTEIGLFRLAVLLALSVFAGFALFQLTTGTSSVRYVIGFYLLAIFLVQHTRKDKLFLHLLSRNVRWLIASEYLFLGVPLFLCLLINGRWTETLLSAFLFVIIAFINLPAFSNKPWLIPGWLIPFRAFEWRAGFRKMGWILFLLFCAAMGTAFTREGIPILMFLLFIFPLSFLEENESYQMVQAFELNPWMFLKKKILIHLLILSKIGLPLVTVYIILHPELWYVPVIEFLLLLSIHMYAVCLKYAFYQPLHKAPPARIFEAIGTASVLIPVLIPLVWVLNIRFLFRAIANLKLYLDDYR